MTYNEAIKRKIKQIRETRQEYIRIANMPEDLARSNSFLKKSDEFIILEALKNYLLEEQDENYFYIEHKLANMQK